MPENPELESKKPLKFKQPIMADRFVRVLQDMGLLPPLTVAVSIEANLGEPILMTYTVMPENTEGVTEERLAQAVRLPNENEEPGVTR